MSQRRGGCCPPAMAAPGQRLPVDPDTQTLACERTCPGPLIGPSSFWYNWSLTNPDTGLVGD